MTIIDKGNEDYSDKKLELTESFALCVINLEKHLREERKEKRISDQIFRSGTSIGANIAESKAKVILFTNYQYPRKKPTRLSIGLGYFTNQKLSMTRYSNPFTPTVANYSEF